MAWRIEVSDQFESRYKKVIKKHRFEAIQALENFRKFFDLLILGKNSLEITKKKGIRPEGKGVIAFDGRGSGRVAAPVRLYAFLELEKEILWQITIGDKSTQKRRDIAEARSFVKKLNRKREEENNG